MKLRERIGNKPIVRVLDNASIHDNEAFAKRAKIWRTQGQGHRH